MASKLKVYGWTGYKISPGSRQSRNIIAATSVAEVLRLAGIKRSEWAWSGGVTANPEDVRQAMSRPGVMFWRPLDDRDAAWNAVEPTTTTTEKEAQ